MARKLTDADKVKRYDRFVKKANKLMGQAGEELLDNELEDAIFELVNAEIDRNFGKPKSTKPSIRTTEDSMLDYYATIGGQLWTKEEALAEIERRQKEKV